jgi:hypothetical protein
MTIREISAHPKKNAKQVPIKYQTDLSITIQHPRIQMINNHKNISIH